MTVEQVDRQMRRAYAPDRMPGTGADRNALGQYGRERVRRDPRTIAAECQRAYDDLRRMIAAKHAATPTREELVAMLAEHEAAAESLRAALAAMDADSGA